MLVWSLCQTAGRGQGSHIWLSEPGGLYFSLLLNPDFSTVQAADLLSSFARHFIAYAADKWHLSLRLKPPNDVWADQGKLMGILVENSFLGNQLEYCIMGIGLNVYQSFTGKKLDFSAVSLCELTDQSIDMETLLYELVQTWDTSFLEGK